MRFAALRLEVLALRLQETSLRVLAETRRAMTQKVMLKLFSICEKRGHRIFLWMSHANR